MWSVFDITDNSFICIRSRQKNLITAKNQLYVLIIAGVMMVSQSNKCILTHSLFKIFEFRNYAIRNKALLIQSYKLFENQFQQSHLGIHWRLSTILKANKKLYEVLFFDM